MAITAHTRNPVEIRHRFAPRRYFALTGFRPCLGLAQRQALYRLAVTYRAVTYPITRRFCSVPTTPDESSIEVPPKFSTGMKLMHGIGTPSVHTRFVTGTIHV